MAYNYKADNVGNEPKLGDFVAYNYSGQIATGWITKIGKGKWHPIFTVKQLHPQDGHVSKVKGGPKCVLVLEAKEEDVS